MIIRELKDKDVPEVENIYDLYWFGDFRENLSKKLKDYIENSLRSIEQKFKYFVAEENGEIIGVIALRKLPSHMQSYANTNNGAELYILAVKYKQKGIGTALRAKIIDEAKKSGYTEMLFFSAESHKDSWAFHNNSDFKQIGGAITPNGEKGKIWRMVF